MEMTLERFTQLADAWGGDVTRWPAEARDAARRLIEAEPLASRRVLARAGRLDAVLRQAPDPAPSAALFESILMAAPVRASPGVWRWLAGAGVGAALAAACAAGVVAGNVLAPMAFRPPALQAVGDPVEEAAALVREPADLAEG